MGFSLGKRHAELRPQSLSGPGVWVSFSTALPKGYRSDLLVGGSEAVGGWLIQRKIKAVNNLC